MFYDREHQWSFPGGIIDPGETSAYAAVHELNEEDFEFDCSLAFN